MRIAVVWDWGLARWVKPVMWDGFRAAMKLIGVKYEVEWFYGDREPNDEFDWIIPWGVGSIPFNNTIQKYKAKKALMCAGHPGDTKNLEKFDAIFVESPLMLKKWENQPNVHLAFGVDTDYFRPKNEEKIFGSFYPATFSPWKRNNLFASVVESTGLLCGTVQPDGVDILKSCKQFGTYTMTDLVPSKVVAYTYNLSRSVMITSWHGSERTALEAMATNVPLIVTSDNELTCSLLPDEAMAVEPDEDKLEKAWLGAMKRKVNTREYILKNYSHVKYAEKILEVIHDRRSS